MRDVCVCGGGWGGGVLQCLPLYKIFQKSIFDIYISPNNYL